MSKVAERIIIKETDVMVLRGIVSGTVPAGNDVQKRAQALLLLSEGHRVMDVAQQLDMRENTITEIRRRFANNGMDSLIDRTRTGRPTTIDMDVVRSKVKEHVASIQAQGKPVPSVKDTAAAIQCSETSVRQVYHEQKWIESRKRSWDFKTKDGMELLAHGHLQMHMSIPVTELLQRICKKASIMTAAFSL